MVHRKFFFFLGVFTKEGNFLLYIEKKKYLCKVASLGGGLAWSGLQVSDSKHCGFCKSVASCDMPIKTHKGRTQCGLSCAQQS